MAVENGLSVAKVRLSRLRLDPSHGRWDSLEELQAWTDARIEAWAQRAICPATGKSVQESWEDELAHLAPLPLLPEPFDVAVTRPVHKDCTVRFEHRTYAVPFALVGQRVEVRGCATTVQVFADGRVVAEYPRGTAEWLLIDPVCYEGEATDRVLPPTLLGRMGSLVAVPASAGSLWQVQGHPLSLDNLTFGLWSHVMDGMATVGRVVDELRPERLGTTTAARLRPSGWATTGTYGRSRSAATRTCTDLTNSTAAEISSGGDLRRAGPGVGSGL